VLGIVLFALFSDAGGSCTANVIVLSDGVIGPHGCAASSIAYHTGIGLMILGAALLVCACVLSVFGRGAVVTAGEASAVTVAGTPPAPVGSGASEATGATPVEPEDQPHDGRVVLPPGWYGNPSNPNGSVQWWDGHRLVDRPPRRV
jgi:hypothetical protein